MLGTKKNIWKMLRNIVWAILPVLFSSSCIAVDNDPFGKIPAEQQQPLKNRLDYYLKLQRDQDWTKLYDLVSDTGRGGVSREKFVAAMKQGHGRDFANEPDLLEFVPKRTESSLPDGFDIHGCA